MAKKLLDSIEKQKRRSNVCDKQTDTHTDKQSQQQIITRLNAFTRSCLCNATTVAAQCHSQQTNSQSLARHHHQVRNV